MSFLLLYSLFWLAGILEHFRTLTPPSPCKKHLPRSPNTCAWPAKHSPKSLHPTPLRDDRRLLHLHLVEGRVAGPDGARRHARRRLPERENQEGAEVHAVQSSTPSTCSTTGTRPRTTRARSRRAPSTSMRTSSGRRTTLPGSPTGA